MLRTRLATAAVAIPLLILLVVAAPGWLFAGIVIALTAIGIGEAAAMALPGQRLGQALVVLAGLAFAFAVLVQSHRPNALGLAVMGVMIGGLVVCLAAQDFPAGVGRLGAGLVAALYGGFLLPHGVALRLSSAAGPRWVFLVIACAMAADTAGYFAGRFLGRHKLAPRVSPNKTIEGAIGATLGGVGGAFVSRAFYPAPGLDPLGTVVFGLILAVLAQAGDLVESMLKRAWGAKDSGWIIPGHGGVLDRTDSLVLPFVFTYYVASGLYGVAL